MLIILELDVFYIGERREKKVFVFKLKFIWKLGDKFLGNNL